MISGLALTLLPPIGTIVIDSVPPATATWIMPAWIACAAWAIDCVPDEQKRLIVIAGTVSGRPAEQRGQASHVHPLLGLRHGAAEDDVLDVRGLQARHPRDRLLDDDAPPACPAACP